MTPVQRPRSQGDTSVVGTLGWVCVVLLCALAALALLSLLGPVGAQ